MGIEKGKWVEGRYVDENGIEILPPFSERPKGYKPPPYLKRGIGKKDINEPVVSVGEIIEDIEKNKKHYSNSFKDLFIIWRKKVFTVPVLTMIGIWIIVYYQISSHNHYIKLTKSTSSSPYVYQPIRLTWETTKNVNR